MAPYRLPVAATMAALALHATLAASALATEVDVHGLLDVVASDRGEAYDFNTLTRDDSPFDPVSLRLHVDARVNDRTQVFTQLMVRDVTGLYLDGAYVMFTPSAALDLHVLAGKIPWLVGTWAPRTYSNVNPLVGSPLMYQYHTTLVWYAVPPSADALLATAGSGQYGANYFGFPMGRGMPIVDDSYWDVGATIAGSTRPIEYAFGVTSGTPGWGTTTEEENDGKSLLGRLGVTIGPAVRLGVSGAYGPYLKDSVRPKLPPGKNVTDYHQILGMADLEVLAGHFEARAEGAMNTWESPVVGDLDVTSGYVELKYAFSFGGYLAGRWDAQRFGEIRDSTGVERSWDHDVTRIEAGAGYRFDRSIVGKVVVQHTTLDLDPAEDESYSLIAAQISVKF